MFWQSKKDSEKKLKYKFVVKDAGKSVNREKMEDTKNVNSDMTRKRWTYFQWNIRLKKAFKELSESKAKDEKKWIQLVKNVMEIKS